MVKVRTLSNCACGQIAPVTLSNFARCQIARTLGQIAATHGQIVRAQRRIARARGHIARARGHIARAHGHIAHVVETTQANVVTCN